jgi:hypothetical protein
MTNTFVEVLAIEATSSAASRVDYRDILRYRAEPGAAVGVGQVVVDSLRHADAHDLVAELIADL